MWTQPGRYVERTRYRLALKIMRTFVWREKLALMAFTFTLLATFLVAHRATPLLFLSAFTPASHLCISLSSVAFVGTAIPAW